ncbi:MAG: hypothetical protein E7292_06185 [Lachnospiraceae bacterium]|nr:hypothetical protein [Lachnospiraceae bacterium]
MNQDNIWSDYGLDELQDGMDKLFPEYDISLEKLLNKLFEGDVIGALAEFMEEIIAQLSGDTLGLKNVFVWLLVLGVVSALMSHVVEVFDKHQVADLSFYFIYLLMSAILLKCFAEAANTAMEALESVVLFGQLLVPVYLLTVGIATGSATAGAYYQLLLILIYGVERILLGVVLPLVYSYCLLSVINGIWIEEKLSLIIELVEKIIGWILKAAIGVVTGISLFQSILTPVLDSARKGAWQKAVSVIPGIGSGAEGAMELVAGSAIVIKNSVGLVLLILLLFLCAVPLLKIFIIAFLLKGVAAFVGIVSDKRITTCTNRTGDAAFLLFKTAGTALVLFMISLAVVATATNRGI